jgi:hypothetical protein
VRDDQHPPVIVEVSDEPIGDLGRPHAHQERSGGIAETLMARLAKEVALAADTPSE